MKEQMSKVSETKTSMDYRIPLNSLGAIFPWMHEKSREMSLEELADHAKLSPQEAKDVLINFVKSIPDEDFEKMAVFGAQITLVT